MPEAQAVIKDLFPALSVRYEAPAHDPVVLSRDTTDDAVLAQCAASLAVLRQRGAGNIPFPGLQFDHMQSKFLRLEAAFDTTALPPALRLYLPLLFDAFFKQAMVDEHGNELTHTDVVNSLERELVSYKCGVGYPGSSFVVGAFGQFFFVSLKAMKGELPKMVQWMRRVLWQIKPDAERLKVAASKLLVPLHSLCMAAGPLSRHRRVVRRTRSPATSGTETSWPLP
jgi:Zn-dependent M16 (insulinase) family peptidase